MQLVLCIYSWTSGFSFMSQVKVHPSRSHAVFVKDPNRFQASTALIKLNTCPAKKIHLFQKRTSYHFRDLMSELVVVKLWPCRHYFHFSNISVVPLSAESSVNNKGFKFTELTPADKQCQFEIKEKQLRKRCFFNWKSQLFTVPHKSALGSENLQRNLNFNNDRGQKKR